MTSEIEKVKFDNSSTIESVEYDHLMENLDIHFKSGSVYRYCGVPANILDEIKQAESVGSYFHKNIKNKFDFSKKQ